MSGVRISGTGSYLPETRLTNQRLSETVDTSDEWIFERSGIRSRRIAEPELATSDLAYFASLKALESAGLKPTDIDAILVATVTPDHFLPSTACLLQARLGCRPILAVDLSAACSGFLYGLVVADSLLRSGVYRHILVLGAETLSRLTNYEDRQTCVLFGDGAGAVVLSKTSDEGSLLYSHVQAIGDTAGVLHVPAGGSREPVTAAVLESKRQYIHMNGREVYRRAVDRLMAECVDALKACELDVNAIDWAVLHQANARIIEKVGENLGISPEKLLMNISETGNTSSASIPILLDQNVRNAKIKRGDLLLLAAFGAGLTSGSAVLRY